MNKQLLYGCMGLGGDWESTAITNEDIQVAHKAIEAALEVGISYFDHADIYKAGKAEIVFGEVLKQQPSLRDKIVLQSKAGIRHHQAALKSNLYDASKSYLLKQVDAILDRLRTDYLDVFMVHRPDPLMHPEELAETFALLKERGKVKYFGVSNMSQRQIEFIQHYLKEPLVANQIQLSLGHTPVLDAGVLVNRINQVDYNGVDGLFEYAQMNNLAIQCWGSLDGGRFTGNYQLASKEDKKTIDYIEELAEKHRTTKESIVLAWLFRLPVMMQPIIGTKNPGRILACKDALSIDMSREEWYDLWILARANRLP